MSNWGTATYEMCVLQEPDQNRCMKQCQMHIRPGACATASHASESLQSHMYLAQVDWERLVAKRSSVESQRRWRLMCKCLSRYWDMSFPEAVCELAHLFAPGLLPRPTTDEAH